MANTPHAKRPWWMPERTGQHWSKSKAADIHNSKKWRKLATMHKQQNPLCVVCLDNGISRPVEITDHIVAIADGGAPYDWNNLQSLCKSCSFDKTMREARERKGKGGV